MELLVGTCFSLIYALQLRAILVFITISYYNRSFLLAIMIY